MQQIAQLILVTTLLNLLMNPHSFSVASLEFSMYSSMSFANSNSFTSSLPFCIPLTFFFNPIAVARTSNTMLNKV